MKILGNRIKSYNGMLIHRKVNLSFTDVNIIVGSNGSGKTTLLNIIMEHSDELKKIYVGEEDMNDDWILNIFKYHIFSNEEKLKTVKKILSEVTNIADMVLINNEMLFTVNNRVLKIHQISGGIRRIISVILAMMADVDIVLIDYIERHMHIGIQKEIINQLLLSNMRAQIFVTTHSPSVISEWISNVISLD